MSEFLLNWAPLLGLTVGAVLFLNGFRLTLFASQSVIGAIVRVAVATLLIALVVQTIFNKDLFSASRLVPVSILAWLASLLAFYLLRKQAPQIAGARPHSRRYHARATVWMTLGSLVAITAATVYLVIQAETRPEPRYGASIVMDGFRTVRALGSPVTFAKSSPGTPLGCDEERDVTTYWEAPPNARIDPHVEARIGFQGRIGQYIAPSVTVQGARVSGVATVRGPSSEPVATLPWGPMPKVCAGAGVAVLTITGKYQIDEESKQPWRAEFNPALALEKGLPTTVRAPTEEGLTITSVTINFIRLPDDDGSGAPATIETITGVNGSPTPQPGSAPFAITYERGSVTLVRVK